MSRPLVTVKTLIAAARDAGEIALPENALITPAAADWLQTTRVPVKKVGAEAPPSSPRAAVYVVGDANCPVVQTILPGLQRSRDGVEFLPCHGRLAGLLDAVRQTCELLRECSQRRGVVLVEHAGPTVSCVANRTPGVQAAILPQPSALFGLMRRLGVNMLILETGRLSVAQLRASLDTFLAGKVELDPTITAALAGGPVACSQESPSCASPR